jgi:hypothetical protein
MLQKEKNEVTEANKQMSFLSPAKCDPIDCPVCGCEMSFVESGMEDRANLWQPVYCYAQVHPEAIPCLGGCKKLKGEILRCKPRVKCEGDQLKHVETVFLCMVCVERLQKPKRSAQYSEIISHRRTKDCEANNPKMKEERNATECGDFEQCESRTNHSSKPKKNLVLKNGVQINDLDSSDSGNRSPLHRAMVEPN